MDVVTLGMLTIDNLVFSDSEKRDLLGGAGTFAVLGARLIAGPAQSKRIGWVIHEGNDFPPHVRAEIDSWNLRSKYISTPERRTTRACNRYDGENRSFHFETPKMQVTPDMLDDDQLAARAFHIISTPDRCIRLVEAVLDLRSSRLGIDCRQRPLFLWEPMEHSCSPNHLASFEHAMSLIDVFSPNELEFALLTGLDLRDGDSVPLKVLRQHSFRFLENCKLSSVVVRLGGEGVYIASMEPAMHDVRMPAFYGARSPGSKQFVVDVTGGGNAFLGAYCFALANDQFEIYTALPVSLNRHESAAVAGSAAASFVIEQFGMPSLMRHEKDSEDKWGATGQTVLARMHDICPKIQSLGKVLP